MNISALAKIVLLGMVIVLPACHDDDDDNTAPVADAGTDQTEGIIAGDVVILDGSGSSDADGHNLSYLWSFVSAPTGSTIEFDDSTSEKSSFTADLVGTYVVQLVVSDGPLDSHPDEVVITVVVPAPTVTITTPEFLSLVDTPTITVEGTVDDPLATLTVNGTDTPNDNGSYSATDIELAEGSNTVTVIATNSTGQGEDSVTVILQTQAGPVMSITSHRNDFTAGHVFDGCPLSEPTSIPVQVHGTVTTENGPPTVDVNGVTATVTDLAVNPALVVYCLSIFNRLDDICNTVDDTRYSYSADIELGVGDATITATASDMTGGSTSVVHIGIADYCYIAEEGVPSACDSAGDDPALRGVNQTKRCHAIDGCSVPGNTRLDLRNSPMRFVALHNKVPVEFGDGNKPPETDEFFVHGQDNTPKRRLGCNVHDVCYQTCASDDAVLPKVACDTLMWKINNAKCRQAYPWPCPLTIGDTDIPDPVGCLAYVTERTTCYTLAWDYLQGLTAYAALAYQKRQEQYCQ